MNKYLDFILKRPKTVIGVLLTITLVLGIGVFKVEFDSSLDTIMPVRDREYILNEKVKDIYGNNGKFIIMCISTDDALRHEFLEKVNNLHLDLEEYRFFDEYRELDRLALFDEMMKETPVGRDALIQRFSGDPAFQRLLERKADNLFGDESEFSRRNMKRLRREIERSNELKKQALVDKIVSPFTMKDLIGEDDTLISYNLIKEDDYGNRVVPETEEEMETFRERLTNNPAFKGGIYVMDEDSGKITDFGVMIRLYDAQIYDPIVDEVKEVAESYGGLDITLQGVPVIHREVNYYLKNDLLTFIPMVLLVIVIVFFLNFRDIRGVALSFLTLILADIWVLGLMGHLGYKLTIMGVALPPLMVAVGSSYAIHIMNQYYIDVHEIDLLGRVEGLKKIMGHISITVFLAGVTTFIGFFMLITNQVSSIREWGVFSAIGVLFAVFISITLIPVFMAILPHRERKERPEEKKKDGGKGPVDAILNAFIYLSLYHYRKVIAVAAVIIIVAIAGMSRIVVETSIHSYFKEGDPVLKSSRVIGEKFGGSLGLNILLDSGERDGVKDPEFLKFVEDFREWLVAEENADLNIGRTDAFTDFIKTFNMAMHNNDHSYYRIPETQEKIQSYINLYSGSDHNDDGRVDDFEPYVDRYYQTMNLFARIWERQGELISSAHMDHAISRINRYLDENLPGGFTYKTSGEPKIIVRLARYVVNGQVMSLGFSLVVIFFVVILLFRNAYAGLFSLIPISFAVLFNFGVMGWFGIKLDLATAIIASITIGIGIDDTIHFVNTFRHYRETGETPDSAIEKTLRVAGKAIIYTSVALIFGFLVLVASHFNPIILFGELVAVTMIATTIGALLILPSAIKLAGVSLTEEQMRSSLWKYLDLGKVFNIDEHYPMEEKNE